MLKPSKKWNYGDSWEKYPIEPGQVWTEIKTGSQFAVHDITMPIPAFLCNADMVYCDPPWNMGNVNSFYTKNGTSPSIKEFSDFYNHLFSSVSQIKPQVCYLEIGKKHLSDFTEKMSDIFPVVQTWPVTYYRKNGSYLIRGGEKMTVFDFSYRDDMDTPALAIHHENLDCVADLCTGRGLTAISAFKLGKRFVGTELNKRRLAVAIDKITALGGQFEIS